MIQSPTGTILKRLGPYSGMILVLADQVIYSAASFLTGVVVGRMLSIGEFGEFGLGASLLIFSIIFQDTLLATPYTFRVHQEAKDRYPSLRAGAIIQSFLLSFFCAAILVAASFIPFGETHEALSPILFSLALCTPFIFLRECFRRMFFAEFKMLNALKLDIAVIIMQFTFIFMAQHYGILSSYTVFPAIALACLIGSVIVWFTNRKDYNFSELPIVSDTLENLKFGRWLLMGSTFHLSSLYGYSWFIFFAKGPVEAGAYMACYNLINLINPFILGFNNYFRPKTMQIYAKQGVAAMDSLIKRCCVLLLPVTIIGVIVLMAIGGWLVRFVYGAEFSGLGMIIGIAGLSILPTVLNAPLQLGVLAMNKPQINPVFHAAALTATITIGIPLVVMYGKTGAAAGYTATTVVSCTVLYVLYNLEVRRRLKQP